MLPPLGGSGLLIGFLCLATGCGSRNPSIALTTAPVKTLTAEHEAEVRSLIEHYWINALSLEAQKNPDELAKFATNPLLETLTSFGTPAPERIFYVTSSVSLDRVIVLEYGVSRIRAIACGRVNQEKISYDGEALGTVNPISIMQAFTFVRADDDWKLAAAYDFSDTKGAIRDWAYVSEAEKSLIGDLSSYTNLYFDCHLT